MKHFDDDFGVMKHFSKNFGMGGMMASMEKEFDSMMKFSGCKNFYFFLFKKILGKN